MSARYVEYLNNEELSLLSKGVKVSGLKVAGMDFYKCTGDFMHVYKKGIVCLTKRGKRYAARESFNYALGNFALLNTITYNEMEQPNSFKVDGLCVSLATPWSFNFFHWVEELVKACWIESHGVHPNYIVPNNSPIFSESLELLGVPKSRIVSVNGSNFEFNECLLCPQIRFQPKIDFKPLLENLQSQIYTLPESGSSKAPCFMLREKGGLTFSERELQNRETTMDFCERRGIECFDPSKLSFRAQVNAFRNRDILAGVHGAGFCHQIWMKQGSSIIEIFSPKYINFTTLNMANALKNNYFMCTDDFRGDLKTPCEPEKVYANLGQLENIFRTIEKLTC